MENIHIAVVGHALSGKDEVARYLAERYDFLRVDTGEFVREYIRENKLGEPTRDLMIKVSNEIRKNFGADYFAIKALEMSHPKMVITGLRVPKCIDTIKEKSGHVIAVDAPIKLRYERAKQRKRLDDDIPFEEFKKHQDIESHNINPAKQNINKVIAMADYRIFNEGTLEDLHLHTERVVSEILNKHRMN